MTITTREEELRAHDQRVAPLIHNSHILYRSPLPDESMRDRYRALGYPKHTVKLFMDGLPVLGAQDGKMTIEYPDGRRYLLEATKQYDSEGKYTHMRYDVIEELEPAER